MNFFVKARVLKKFGWVITYVNILIQIFITYQARRNEKNSGGEWGGATNSEIFSATMVVRRRKFFLSNRLNKMAKKTLWEAGNINFPHKWVFSKELFRASSQSLQIFKVFGGLKFNGTVMQIEKA